MPSLGSIFSIASSALRAQQQGLDVAGHNIANANTEGYSRQRVRMKPRPPLQTPDGVFGTGVTVDDVERIRDTLLDGQVWAQRGAAGRSGTRSDYLSRVEGLIAEPGEEGVGAAFDRYFSAFSELATQPDSHEARTVVRARGAELARSFRHLSDSLGSVREEAENRLVDEVRRANALLDQVATLNSRIVSVEASGGTASDLRDDRARALDELASIVDISVVSRGDGSVGVHTDGRSIVDRDVHRALAAEDNGGTLELTVEGSTTPLSEPGGSTGGILDFLNDDLPAIREELDALAAGLVEEVNAVHRTGANPDGVSEAGYDGVAFFDPAGTTASSIALSQWVDDSAGAVAAGTPDSSGDYRPGANDVALEIAALRDEPVGSLGGRSLPETYRSLVTDVGIRARDASERADFQTTLQERAERRRISLSGVSTDEELVRIIRFQTAYQAAARVVRTADEMLDTLLAM